MFNTNVYLEELGLSIAMEGNNMVVLQAGQRIVYPRAKVQDVIDALMVIAWAIDRREETTRRLATRSGDGT